MDTIAEGQKYTRGARKKSQSEISKSAITDHAKQHNHIINWDSAKIVAKEADWRLRGIKEAIVIRQEDNMNRDEGRYTLSHLYDDILTKDRD